MRLTPQSPNLISFALLFCACAISFLGGYFVRGHRTNRNVDVTTLNENTILGATQVPNSRSAAADDFKALLSAIDEEIDRDNWRDNAGTSTIESFSTTIYCTPEDIFGSREAYQKMFDDMPEEVSTIENPFESEAENDLFENLSDQ